MCIRPVSSIPSPTLQPEPPGHTPRLSPAAEATVPASLPPDQTRLQTLPRGTAMQTLSLAPAFSAAALQRLQVYYGTADLNAMQAQARQILGIDQTESLPDPASRLHNFERFGARHFPQRPPDSDESDLNTYGPEPGMPVYDLLKAYALTDYGALMIQRVLAQPNEPPFVIKAVPDTAPKAWNNIIILPPDFPRSDARFAIGGQRVDPLAIIHHEFEHTRFGRFRHDENNLLEEENFAVREVENPVRILNGFEPRYTYTQLDPAGQAVVSFSILQPERRQPGAWTFDPADPRQLIPFERP
ncbi:MAG: hypothetical protein IGS03_04415 [Candidatus Sericytochromatia bacterium]|nr:hypothetical protein [Candidatus Sericytochromatia bacterium]